MNEQIITFNEIFSPKGGIFPNLRTSPQKLSINLGDIPKGIKHNLSSIQQQRNFKSRIKKVKEILLLEGQKDKKRQHKTQPKKQKARKEISFRNNVQAMRQIEKKIPDFSDASMIQNIRNMFSQRGKKPRVSEIFRKKQSREIYNYKSEQSQPKTSKEKAEYLSLDSSISKKRIKKYFNVDYQEYLKEGKFNLPNIQFVQRKNLSQKQLKLSEVNGKKKKKMVSYKSEKKKPTNQKNQKLSRLEGWNLNQFNESQF